MIFSKKKKKQHTLYAIHAQYYSTNFSFLNIKKKNPYSNYFCIVIGIFYFIFILKKIKSNAWRHKGTYRTTYTVTPLLNKIKIILFIKFKNLWDDRIRMVHLFPFFF